MSEDKFQAIKNDMEVKDKEIVSDQKKLKENDNKKISDILLEHPITGGLVVLFFVISGLSGLGMEYLSIVERSYDAKLGGEKSKYEAETKAGKVLINSLKYEVEQKKELIKEKNIEISTLRKSLLPKKNIDNSLLDTQLLENKMESYRNQLKLKDEQVNSLNSELKQVKLENIQLGLSSDGKKVSTNQTLQKVNKEIEELRKSIQRTDKIKFVVKTSDKHSAGTTDPLTIIFASESPENMGFTKFRDTIITELTFPGIDLEKGIPYEFIRNIRYSDIIQTKFILIVNYGEQGWVPEWLSMSVGENVCLDKFKLKVNKKGPDATKPHFQNFNKRHWEKRGYWLGDFQNLTQSVSIDG